MCDERNVAMQDVQVVGYQMVEVEVMAIRQPQHTVTTPHRIFKYPVPIQDIFTVEMPENYEVLDVQVQQGKPVMWALVLPDATVVTKRFRLVGTGHPVEADEHNRLTHVGSFQMAEGALVFHLFEVYE